MNTTEPPFFLVWAEDGGEPHVKHVTQDSAEREAERLCRANPGTSFCVMVPIARYTERRVDVERFAIDDELPF